MTERTGHNFRAWLAGSLLLSIFLCSCDQIQRPASEPFVGVSPPPARQEFRWSNGRLPKSFDPGRAAAAPETDIVRALYEGLTCIDPATSKPIPALAEKWTSSSDHKTWTFTIRKDARWSNGKRITASDIVSSWKRLPLLGDKGAHRELYRNILGINEISPPSAPVKPAGAPHDPGQPDQVPSPTPPPAAVDGTDASRSIGSTSGKTSGKTPALEAVDDRTLNVSLNIGDKDLPSLVADPIFRPIYGDGSEFEKSPLPPHLVTSGPFEVAEIGAESIALNRSDTYWNADAVALEHVRFVAKETAEASLDAYKKGELDAVTNADFEPLALKLLTPYKDFKQNTHGALNFYEINTAIFPFNDRRIREALAISIDRDRLVETELEGAAEPATRLLPSRSVNSDLVYDAEHARELLERSGFPSGEGFPRVRLVIARNDLQQRVARAIAKMWKQNLGIDTQIIIKEQGEMESVRLSGEFDLIRRGTVLPTDDVLMGLGSILGSDTRLVQVEPESSIKGETRSGPSVPENPAPSPARTSLPWTQEDALYEMNVVPLYFPLSYTLVKPYVEGFDVDGNGCPDLKGVRIDNNWTPKQGRPAS